MQEVWSNETQYVDDTPYSQILDNFKICRQLHMLTGELRDLRNNKGSRDLTAVSLGIPVSGVKHNVSNLVFSLCISDSSAKVQDTARSLLHAPPAHTSC